jgi:tetratricopeptide repeat protein 21B
MQRQQREVSSDISHKLGIHFEKVKDLDKAQQHFSDALKSNDSNEKVMLSMAKLALKQGDVNTCQRHCMTLMRIDQNNDEASLMISDLMFQKNDFETAVYHYRQFLERKPNHYVALSRLINVLRRSGKLESAEQYMKTAERTSPRSAFQAGFNFCQGLFHRYSNRLHEAVTFFNKARRDHEWGNEALYHMIQIYLNPNNENVWDDPEGDLDNGGDSLKVAEELLRELPIEDVPMKLKVLECQVLLYSRNRSSVERCVQKLQEIIEVDRDYVPAILCLSEAYLFQKQLPKARNQLKRMVKIQYQNEYADEFEKSYVILADVYVQKGKYDLAQDLCKRCLQYNRSCAKAWELMGLIMEKEQSYKDAADNYEHAWKCEGGASASVGFKLAFNYLKAKRLVEAIDVCHQVLELYPDYPKIRTEVLEKARAGLRS